MPVTPKTMEPWAEPLVPASLQLPSAEKELRRERFGGSRNPPGTQGCFFLLLNTSQQGKLRVRDEGFPTSQLAPDQNERLGGRPNATVVAELDDLVLLEWKQEFSTGELILFARWEPDAWSDLCLVD